MICPHCQNAIHEDVYETTVHLSRTERMLIDFMHRNRGMVLSRADIVEGVWGSTYQGLTNIVDVFVSYIRQKLGHEVIRTERGKGYMMPEGQ